MRFYINIISLLVILSSPSIDKIILTTAVRSGEIVSMEYITGICSKSSNRSLCFDLLEHLIGSGYDQITLRTLAKKPLDMAEALAGDTYKMIKRMYESSIRPKRQVCKRYERCMLAYSDVIKDLGVARGFMQGEKPRNLKKNVVRAADRVNSCDGNFIQRRQIPLSLKNANQKFKDHCNVLVTIATYWNTRNKGRQ